MRSIGYPADDWARAAKDKWDQVGTKWNQVGAKGKNADLKFVLEGKPGVVWGGATSAEQRLPKKKKIEKLEVQAIVEKMSLETNYKKFMESIELLYQIAKADAVELEMITKEEYDRNYV